MKIVPFFYENARKTNKKYEISIINPLYFETLPLFGNNTRKKIRNAKINIQIKSLSTISDATFIGFMIEVIPKTKPILKIFDPIKFPTEIPFSFFEIAIIDVANSGILVPIAITETEITASLILICCAKLTAPLTKNSAPK